MISFQDRLGLEGDILTDNLHPLPSSRRRSKPSDEAEALPTRAKSQRRSKPWNATEVVTESDLISDLIVKEEMDLLEDISIKSEPGE